MIDGRDAEDGQRICGERKMVPFEELRMVPVGIEEEDGAIIPTEEESLGKAKDARELDCGNLWLWLHVHETDGRPMDGALRCLSRRRGGRRAE